MKLPDEWEIALFLFPDLPLLGLQHACLTPWQEKARGSVT